jgi:hypothetical protein
VRERDATPANDSNSQGHWSHLTLGQRTTREQRFRGTDLALRARESASGCVPRKPYTAWLLSCLHSRRLHVVAPRPSPRHTCARGEREREGEGERERERGRGSERTPPQQCNSTATAWSPVQGYLAHKKQPPFLGPSQEPRHGPTVGSHGGAVSYERGTLLVAPRPSPRHTCARGEGERGPHGSSVAARRQPGHRYRGTSLTRKRTPLGPYHRPVPRVQGES